MCTDNQTAIYVYRCANEAIHKYIKLFNLLRAVSLSNIVLYFPVISRNGRVSDI